MDKRTRIIVLIGAAVVATYLLYRYIRSRGNQGSGTGALGSNLNSVAPELVGGSAGPMQVPAVDVPVNITLSQVVPDQDNGRNTNLGANPIGPDSADAQQISALNAGVTRQSQAQQPMKIPMQNSKAVSASPMTAQHRAAGKTGPNPTGSSPQPYPGSHAAHHNRDR